MESEEEDKFSDFDPTSLPEPDPEISQNSCQTETIAAPRKEIDAFDTEKRSVDHPTDDYMSDVSSGEDFLSATHDQSGLEDGEVSEAEELISSKQSEVNSKCDTVPDSIVEQNKQQTTISNSSLGPIDGDIKNQTKSLTGNTSEATSDPQETTDNKETSANLLLDNASPIDYEDLESLEDFDQEVVTKSNDIIIEQNNRVTSESENTSCNKPTGEIKNFTFDNETVNLSESAVECANLNPEPIDSSPDLLNTCEEETTENIDNISEDNQKKPDVQGKM